VRKDAGCAAEVLSHYGTIKGKGPHTHLKGYHLFGKRGKTAVADCLHDSSFSHR
jgi:hypothetical protein